MLHFIFSVIKSSQINYSISLSFVNFFSSLLLLLVFNFWLFQGWSLKERKATKRLGIFLAYAFKSCCCTFWSWKLLQFDSFSGGRSFVNSSKTIPSSWLLNVSDNFLLCGSLRLVFGLMSNYLGLLLLRSYRSAIHI